MTGFPGETDEDFAALLDFQQKAALDWLGVFSYSREEDTPAYSFKGRVPKKIALVRKKMLEEAQIPISEARQARFVGKKGKKEGKGGNLKILVEEVLAGTDDQGVELCETVYLGRCYAQAPEVDGAVVIHTDEALVPGSFVTGTITGCAGYDLQAVVSRAANVDGAVI
jgi:ribosomal protein S12 methylthiotransferase